MRKGLFKKYIRNQYNDENIKGPVDIPRHIDQNTPFIGNIAYNQREFSYDNTVIFTTGPSVNTVSFPTPASPPTLRSNEKDKERPNLGTPLLPLSSVVSDTVGRGPGPVGGRSAGME